MDFAIEHSDANSRDESNRTWRAYGLLLVLFPYPLFVISLFEVLRLPWSQFAARFSPVPLFVQAWGDYFGALNDLLLPVIGLQLVVFVVALLLRNRGVGLWLVAAAGGLASALAVHWYFSMYPPLRDHPVILAGLTAFAISVAGGIVAVFSVTDFETLWKKVLGALGFATLVGGVGALIAHHTVLPNLYPAFHMGLIALSFAAMFWGCAFVARITLRGHFDSSRFVASFLGITAVLVITLAVGGQVSVPGEIEPYLVSTSEIKAQPPVQMEGGRTMPPHNLECSDPERSRTMDRSEAVETFFDHSGYPRLDGQIPLDEWNVLFIVVEAVRFDETSLAGGSNRDLTPNLAQLADDGAFNFVRAQTPSSNTLQTLGGLMTMTYPSFSPLVVDFHDRAKGLLRNEPSESPTVAERFGESGHQTFRVVHPGLGSERSGFARGFDVDRVVSEDPDDPEHAGLDERITHEALDLIDRSTSSEPPWFGWLFYWSPHDPYVVRDEGRGTSRRDAYRQEIRHADAQIGRVVEHLEQSGTLDETVLVITSDHGQGFGAHGTRYHGNNLYQESIHVPLLVSIPSMAGTTVEEPVSLSFLFTWLLLHSNSEVHRSAVVEQLAAQQAAMLSAEDGAVVSELLRPRGGYVSMTKDDHKLIYQIGTGRTEFFDLVDDPGEQEDLYLSRPPELEPAMERLERYLEFRACNERFFVVR